MNPHLPTHHPQLTAYVQSFNPLPSSPFYWSFNTSHILPNRQGLFKKQRQLQSHTWEKTIIPDMNCPASV